MGSPNWARLKQQGRAKDIGVPWSAEEANAVFVLKIPAEFVRRGCITTEDYDELKAEDEKVMSKDGELPLAAMPREQLLKKANDAGIVFTNDATEETLRALIDAHESKKSTVTKVTEKVAKKVAKKTKK